MLPPGNVLGELDFNVLLMIAGIGIPFTLAAIVPAYIYIWLLCGVSSRDVPNGVTFFTKNLLYSTKKMGIIVLIT